MKNIAIVGAGASGLVAARTLLDKANKEGKAQEELEKGKPVQFNLYLEPASFGGGNWVFVSGKGWILFKEHDEGYINFIKRWKNLYLRVS